MPKPYVLLEFSEKDGLSLDAIIGAIRVNIPQTVVLSEDWYRERHAEEQAVIDTMPASPGTSWLTGRMHQCIDDAEREWGPAKLVQILLSDGLSISGRICRKFALLHCDAAIPGKAIEPLLSAVQDLGILTEFSTANVGVAEDT